MDSQTAKLTNQQLLAFFGMVVGMFMAILDIQIVASSLSVIAAGLSASSDELSWVQTSYLIAEVIIIPISGFIAKVLSTRIAYFAAACGFTVMSVLCSVAWNIESMIIFRALQGLFGGAMIPTVFSIIFIMFPPKTRPLVTIIIGLVVTVAPTLGPTLGGYITDITSWHFMFLLNVIPGIFVCSVVYLYADFDKPNYSLLKNFDYTGIISMIIALSALQYILEEGNKKDWFTDNLILLLSIVALISFVILIVRELTFSNPILDFSAFNNKNFTFGCLYSFVVGIGLYGTVYLLPLFLYVIAGFNTIQIGTTMMVTGLAQFLSAPIAGKLSGMGVDLRLILCIGLSMFATGCYANSFLTPDSRYWELFIPQVIRGASLMFCFIPINNVALGTMGRDKVQNASGLYNLTRNLGGAIGLAAISTMLTAKVKIFSQYMSEHITSTSVYSLFYIEKFKQILAGKVIDPEKAAIAFLDKMIYRDAFIIAINEIFVVISLLFIFSMLFLPFTTHVQAANEESVH